MTQKNEAIRDTKLAVCKYACRLQPLTMEEKDELKMRILFAIHNCR